MMVSSKVCLANLLILVVTENALRVSDGFPLRCGLSRFRVQYAHRTDAAEYIGVPRRIGNDYHRDQNPIRRCQSTQASGGLILV
jgi:hypothetical protein